MNVAIGKCLPHMDQVDFDFVVCPIEAFLEQLEAKGLQPIEQVRFVESTQHLEIFPSLNTDRRGSLDKRRDEHADFGELGWSL